MGVAIKTWRTVRHLVALLAFAVLPIGCASRTPAAEPSAIAPPSTRQEADDAQRRATVDAAAAAFSSKTRVKDFSVLVMRGEETHYLRHFGSYDDRTIVPLASATKWITGATIMSLVDDGLLDLDAPIGRWLPSLPETHRALTLRQLLSYTAGFAPLSESGADIRQNKRISLSEGVQELAALPLRDPPGTAFAYGGANFQFAGAAAEQAGGASWAELFRRRLGDGLAMSDFLWSNPTGPNPPDSVRNPLLQGGAATTLNAYSRFLTMIAQRGVYGGRRFLSEAAIDEMERVETRGVTMRYVPPGAGPGMQYNLAHWCEREAAERCVLLSSPGAFGVYPWIDRETGLHGVIFMQDRLGPIANDVRALRDAAMAAYR
ncbi:serine hydrolase [bacterium]|nr:serine hydrolase [bacterium]